MASRRAAFLTPPRHNPLSYGDNEEYEECEECEECEEYGEYDAPAREEEEEEEEEEGEEGPEEEEEEEEEGASEYPKSTTVGKRAARLFWSRREVLQQKSGWLDKTAALRKRRSDLERGCCKQLFETRTAGLRAAAQELGGEHRKLEQAREKMHEKIAAQLTCFREKTVRLRRQIQSVVREIPAGVGVRRGGAQTIQNAEMSSAAASPARRPPPDEHRQRRLLEGLHATFDALEADVATFKREGRGRYQELQHEERVLEREVAQFAERCRHWDAAGADSCSAILRELKLAGGDGGRGEDHHRAGSEMATPSPGRRSRGGARRSGRGTCSSSAQSATSSASSASSASSRPQEIIDIERRIEELGGRTGGWDSRDHATFLRLLSRYNLRQAVTVGTTTTGSGKKKQIYASTTAPSPGSAASATDVDQRRVQSMVSYAATKLSHLSVDISSIDENHGSDNGRNSTSSETEDAVRAHWEWFQEFSSLEEQKRTAVKRWREQRSRPRSSTSADSTTSPSSFVTPRGAAPAKKGSASSFSSSSSLASAAWERRKRESDRKKQELAEWKAQRAAATARADAEKKSEEREARLARKRAAAQRAADKEEIAMYRLQREAADAHQQAVAKVLATARGRAPGPPTSGRALRRRHERNMAKVRKKQEDKAHAEEEKARRKARLDKITEKVNKRVATDFSRLTRHTTASAHNVLTHESLDKMEEQRRRNMGGHRATYSSHTGAEFSRGTTFTFAKASSLKVPTWRKVAMR
jgi:hypothetical protein